MDNQAEGEAITGSTITAVSYDRFGQIESLTVTDKAGKVHKVEAMGEYGAEAWLEVSSQSV